MSRNVINCIFAFVLFAIWFVVLDLTNGTRFSDFPAYYATGMQVRAGRAAQIYDMDVQQAEAKKYFAEGEGRAFEPPYALPMFCILPILPPFAAKVIFDSVLALALSMGCVILAKVAQLNGRHTLLLICLVALCGPVFEVFKVSKPSALFFLAECVCIYFLSRKKDREAGGATVLCLLKPHEILPMFAFALGAKRLQFLMVSVLVAVAVIVLTLPFVGIDSYRAYQQLVAFLSTHPEVPGVSSMPTMRGQLLRLDVATSLGAMASNILYALAVAICGAIGWKRRNDDEWWKSGVIVAFTLGVAAAPYMHLYDHVVMIPAVVFLIQRLFAADRKPALVLAVICIATLMQPFYSFIHYYYLIGANGIVNVHFIAITILACVAVWSEMRRAAQEHRPYEGV